MPKIAYEVMEAVTQFGRIKRASVRLRLLRTTC